VTYARLIEDVGPMPRSTGLMLIVNGCAFCLEVWPSAMSFSTWSSRAVSTVWSMGPPPLR
jgi:hypothetical protein